MILIRQRLLRSSQSRLLSKVDSFEAEQQFGKITN
nr:MAG TPA: hypothetical protein [Caudoviricetes sp.]